MNTIKKKSLRLGSSQTLFARQTSIDKIKDALGRKGPKGAKKYKNELTYSGLPESDGIALLICDPQNDFHAGGSMATKKSNEMSQKIAQLIKVYGGYITEIYITLQQRPSYHIGHAGFWIDAAGKDPEPFVHIDSSDIAKRNYLAVRLEHSAWTKKYFEQLKKKDIHNIIVFPEHCVVGTPGAAVVESIASAVREWEKKQHRCAHYILKGTNSRTEQYSAFQSLVQLKDDESTALNRPLLTRLLQHDKLIICGYTLSHSVKYSVLDLLANGKPSDAKIFLVHDCCSSLSDFKNGAAHFLEQMKEEDRVVLTTIAAVSSVFEGNDSAAYDDELNATSRSLATVATFKNAQFDFGDGILEEGCYLLYNDQNYGSLFVVWSKAPQGDDERLRNCLGFFKAGTGARVPEFKFQNGGQTELVRELSKSDGGGRRRKLFTGVLRFIQDCKTFRGAFVFQSAILSGNDDLVEFGLYALTKGGAVVPVENDQFCDPADFDVVNCIPKAANNFRGVSKQSKQLFMQTGDSLGATLELK